jgi:hypothetical protein
VLAESGPPELVEQLSAIERAGETSQRLAAASTFTNGVTCALGGALLGAAVLLGGLETNRAIGLSVGVGLLVVALGLAGFESIRKRTVRLGWYRAAGRWVTVAYLLVMSCAVLRGSRLVGPLPAVWIPWALVTAGPLLVIGVRELAGVRSPTPG